MNKKSNGIWSHLTLALFLIVLPNLFIVGLHFQTNKLFYEQLESNREVCRDRAKLYNFSDSICYEVISNSREAFSSARENYSYPFIMLTAVVYTLTVTVLGLRKQIEELKEKIDA